MSKGHPGIKGYFTAACLAFCFLISACSSNKSVPSKGSYNGTTYTVKRGDTLWRIAHMSGRSVSELARLNSLSAPYTLAVGQKLKIKTTKKAVSKPVKRPPSRKTTPPARPPSTAIAQHTPPTSRCWRWPAQGNIVQTFSASQGGNKGIDIAGKRGQPIYAAGSGRVVYAGNQLRGYGNLILLKHSEEYITAYGHNETLLVRDGQQVVAGQKIATMGSSGANSVRLHFQIRYKATAIDPQWYLPPACK
ncbi:peptidoglycan DD-metalloendopeptidase family protein [Erwinia sp. HR93]|uniref:peptidoglycan DD-metalloendopeptidase family protein n=1 Tax=Erwinia sp. HR93 TaxID=3094840 RepID=UPI003A101C6F